MQSINCRSLRGMLSRRRCGWGRRMLQIGRMCDKMNAIIHETGDEEEEYGNRCFSEETAGESLCIRYRKVASELLCGKEDFRVGRDADRVMVQKSCRLLPA